MRKEKRRIVKELLTATINGLTLTQLISLGRETKLLDYYSITLLPEKHYY